MHFLQMIYIYTCAWFSWTFTNSNIKQKYSTVSMHKLSRAIFVDPLLIKFTLSLQDLLFGSIPNAIHARNSLRLGYILFH
jgi:hypothetical protein